MQIDTAPANYDPNSIGDNWPRETPPEEGGFSTAPQPVSGVKERLRSPSFAEYYCPAPPVLDEPDSRGAKAHH